MLQNIKKQANRGRLMKKYINIFASILFIFVFFLIQNIIFADNFDLRVVYPSNGATVNASSTFFVGATHPDAVLTINQIPVKVYSNGSFVQVFDLKKGANKIIVKSVLNDKEKEISYTLFVPNNSEGSKPITEKALSNEAFQYFTAKVIKDDAPIRKTPGGDRLTPIKKDTVIYIDMEKNGHYRVKFAEDKLVWISKNDVEVLNVSESLPPVICKKMKVINYPDKVIIKAFLDNKTPVEITEKNNLINIDLFNTISLKKRKFKKLPCFINEIKQEQTTGKLSLSVDLNAKNLYGYDYFYEGNVLNILLKKPPQIHPHYRKFKLKNNECKLNVLNGKIITIDAGHGGKESGSVGPTGVPEKDVNLAIAYYLKEILEKEGAKVILTREKDDFLGLYERPEIAKCHNSDILVSIHNNALPDGQDPYITHGTSTYYYQNQAIPLAEAVQASLVKKIGFKDLGIIKESFVLTRPSNPVSVLVEVGFMINPFEYEKLIDSQFQKQAAEGIKDGIEKYFAEAK